MPMRLLPLMIGAALVAAPAAAQDNNAATNNTDRGDVDQHGQRGGCRCQRRGSAVRRPTLRSRQQPAAPAPAKKSFPWGVLGLLGLVGLFGKRRRS